MTLRRFEDWPLRLEAAVTERAGKPFQWGDHDCCLAVCDVVKEMTGTDLARGLRRYKTKRGAMNRMGRFGGVAGVAAAMAEKYHVEEIDPPFCQRGDVVVIEADQGPTLGIVWLDGRTVMAASEVGWSEHPLEKATRAWRV